MAAGEKAIEARDDTGIERSDGRLTRRRFVIGTGSAAVLAGTGALAAGCGATAPPFPVQEISELPPPRHGAPVSLERGLLVRRSHREFTAQPLTEREISQLLWAAQGITAEWGGRTTPSAGGLYPLELYLLTADTYRQLCPSRAPRRAARIRRSSRSGGRRGPAPAGGWHRRPDDRDHRRVRPHGQEIWVPRSPLRSTRGRARRAERLAPGRRARPRRRPDRSVR